MNRTPKPTVKAIIREKLGHFREVPIPHEKAVQFAAGMEFTTRLSRTIKSACSSFGIQNHAELADGLAKRSETRIANLVAGKEKPLTESEYIRRSINVRDAIYIKRLPDGRREELESSLAELYRRNGPVWSTIINMEYDILLEIRGMRIIPDGKFVQFAKHFLRAFYDSRGAIILQNQ